MKSTPDVRKDVASPAEAGAPGTSERASSGVPEELTDVASSTSAQTSSAGDPGALKVASSCAPDPVSGIVMVETRKAHNLQVAGSNPAPATNLHLESLADFSDEGETGWNTQRRADMARKMHRIAAGANHYSHDELEGVVIRAERGELAEVEK